MIGHIGRLEEQKNHRLLLKIVQHILKKHPNTYLLSVGAGSLEAEIHDLAKELKIRNVLFLGEREDIAELLKAMESSCCLRCMKVCRSWRWRLRPPTSNWYCQRKCQKTRCCPKMSVLCRWMRSWTVGKPKLWAIRKATVRNRKWKHLIC